MAFQNITSDAARISLIWILGEYGNEIPDACSIIEVFVNKLEEEKEENIELKSTMLTACVKLFLKRPPETYETLAKIMNLIINDDEGDLISIWLHHWR